MIMEMLNDWKVGRRLMDWLRRYLKKAVTYKAVDYLAPDEYSRYKRIKGLK